MKKFHNHQCEECTHLNSVREYDEELQQQMDYDLYYCPQGSRPTLIARYGEHENYFSGLSFSHEGILKKAAELAISKGLLNREEWIKETKRFID